MFASHSANSYGLSATFEFRTCTGRLRSTCIEPASYATFTATPVPERKPATRVFLQYCPLTTPINYQSLYFQGKQRISIKSHAEGSTSINLGWWTSLVRIKRTSCTRKDSNTVRTTSQVCCISTWRFWTVAQDRAGSYCFSPTRSQARIVTTSCCRTFLRASTEASIVSSVGDLWP